MVCSDVSNPSTFAYLPYVTMFLLLPVYKPALSARLIGSESVCVCVCVYVYVL